MQADFMFTINDIDEFTKLKIGDTQIIKVIGDKQFKGTVFASYECKIVALNFVMQTMWLKINKEFDGDIL